MKDDKGVSTVTKNAGSKVWENNMESFINFFSQRERGSNWKKDFAEWCDEISVSDRAGSQYADRRITAGDIKITGNKWKWNGAYIERERTQERTQEEEVWVPPPKAQDLFEKMEIRESMTCKDMCEESGHGDLDCRECRKYKNKIAMEEQLQGEEE